MKFSPVTAVRLLQSEKIILNSTQPNPALMLTYSTQPISASQPIYGWDFSLVSQPVVGVYAVA